MANGRAVRELMVSEIHQLTPQLLRMVLTGQDLADFPQGQEGGYIKLRFPHSDPELKPRVRSYTIVNFAYDATLERYELTIDFALHGDTGLASAWALTAKVGDTISIDGPGSVKLVDAAADWFFLVGDMTALPALNVNLQKLPSNAKGYVVLDIVSEAEKTYLTIPEGLQVHWVINPHPDQPNNLLVDTVKSLTWEQGQANVWVACEFEAMRQLRRYFKQDRAVDKNNLYISSYWKMGVTDEENKRAKKMDAEANL